MTHGIDGWTLVEYEWDPATERGWFLYSNGKEHRSVVREQPLHRRRRN